ncbi:MAG: ABC transporter permease [Caldilineaceae bacterium]|nr:ABC transporter permease [Caldilineaceae bacterium]
MNYIWTYTRNAILRNGYRTLGMLLGTLLATGLLSAVLFYVDASAAQMTQAALANVPVDMQVVALTPDTHLADLQTQLAAQPDVTGVAPFSLAGFTSAQLTGGDRATATTPGALIAIEPNYLSLFDHPQLVQGQLSSDGVLISKDMATNLGAKPGDAILLHFPDPAPPYQTIVSGIADLSGADALFAPTDAQHRGLAFNPPTNVVIMDWQRFNRDLRAALLAAPAQPVIQQVTVGAAANLTASGSGAANVVSVDQPAVSEQLHIRIDRAQLPGDPIQAQKITEQLRRLLERQAPGQISALNNLNAVIETVKGDILWAKILAVFLAGPGILLAAYLSRYATANLVAAQRQELALLRARGATPRQVVGLSVAISAVIALVGVLLGLVLGLLSSAWLASSALLTMSNLPLLLRSTGVVLLAGLLFVLVGIILPTRTLYLAEVQAGRRQIVVDPRPPLWQRLYGDLLLLAAGLVVLWITKQNGFAPVVNGEGNATLSLSLFTFLAPALIWLGAALLLLRLSGRLLQSGTSRLARGLPGGLGAAGSFAARGIARRFAPLQQITLIIALAVAFGISLSGFAATYRQQQRVDAELTLGADVRVTPDRAAPQSAAFADQLRNLPNVVAVSPFDLNVAYVGSELQDIFGVNVFSLRETATLADSFFLDAPADMVLSKLDATPDGIIISEETALDYSIVAGDYINIRLQRASVNNASSGANSDAFVTVPFQVVGIAREFPTAPKDSFLVVNQDFLHQQIGSDSVATFLVRTTGNPTQTAAAISAQFPAPTFKVESINDVTAQLTSTLTTLSLDALTRIEWGYTLLIAALALLIFLLGLLGERATEYATVSALGGTPGQVNTFVLAEALISGVTGLVIGSLVGLALTQVLVTILTAIFDPPPSHMLIPVSATGLLLALVAIGLMLSGSAAALVLRRLSPAQILRNA